MKKASTYFIVMAGVLLPCLLQAGSAPGSEQIDLIGPRTTKVETDKYRQVYYVSVQTGSDKNGEGTRSKPWQTLVFALNHIKNASESSPCAVFAAAGFYDQGTIIMRSHIDLYGGFANGNWQRDISEYRTELNGQGVRRVVMGANHAKIDGFTIRNGLAEGHGGGILCEDTSPEITNNYILDNIAAKPLHFNRTRIHQEGHHGGAIACLYNAVPQIRNNYFEGNETAIGNGGAVAFYGWLRLEGAPEPSIEHNRMSGGLQASLEHNVFIHNIAGMDDLTRTRSSNGGAVSCAYEARPVIKNNLIIGNQARGRGDAGGIYVEYFSYPLIEQNRIIGNIGDDDGGGIYVMKLSHPLIDENLIGGNWTQGGGVGGIRISKEGRATIRRNRIFDNPGGAIQCVDSYVEIDKNVIIDNHGAYGIYFSSLFDYTKASVIRENIIRNNSKGAFILAKKTVQAPVFENNNLDDESIHPGQGNMNRPPSFSDDGFSGEFIEMVRDRQNLLYEMKIKIPPKDPQVLKGRIVKVNDHWGIICAVRDNHLILWGDFETLPGNSKQFEIVPSYSVN